jgi:hypothetical protein
MTRISISVEWAKEIGKIFFRLIEVRTAYLLHVCYCWVNLLGARETGDEACPHAHGQYEGANIRRSGTITNVTLLDVSGVFVRLVIVDVVGSISRLIDE